MRFFLLLCCYFLLLSPLPAQKNFKPGYIILQHNDTLHGAISFRVTKINPEKINFLPDTGGELITYGPNDIKGFFIKKNDQYHFYESHTLKRDYSKKPASHPSDSSRFFLYVYLKDEPLSLYYYQGQSSYFFIQQNGEPLTVLPNPEQDRKGGKSLPMEKYKRHLFSYLADWPEAMARINRTRYNNQPLLQLIREYNTYKQGGQRPAYIQVKPPGKVQLGIFAGTSITQIIFRSQENLFDHLTQGTTGNSLSPALGISFNLTLLDLLPELSLYNEVAYRSFKSEINYIGPDYWKPQTVSKLDIAYIRPSHMFRWTFLNTSLQPFVQAGFWYAVAIQKETTSVTQRYSRVKESYQEFETRDTFDKNGFKPFEVGIATGAGLSYQKFSAELRYEYGNGMSDFVNLSAVSHTAGLFLTYRIL